VDASDDGQTVQFYSLWIVQRPACVSNKPATLHYIFAMSYRTPSQKVIAQLAESERWDDDDVVIEGLDQSGKPMSLTRRQAWVPGALVRRWLVVRDANGQPLLRVMRTFVSADGFLFSVRDRDRKE
jgi:hypothetical protein